MKEEDNIIEEEPDSPPRISPKATTITSANRMKEKTQSAKVGSGRNNLKYFAYDGNAGQYK